MNKKEFQKLLAPYQKRLGLETSLRVGLQALVCGAAAGIVMRILSAFLPLRITVWMDIAAAAAVFLCVFTVFRILRRPRTEEVAKRLDAAGFDNRAETCLALLNDDSVFAELQRRDTKKTIASFTPKRISLRLNRKLVCVGLAALLLFSGCLFLPNANLNALAAEEEKRDEQMEAVEKAVEKVEKTVEEAKLSPDAKLEAKEVLENLKIDLQKDRNITDMLAHINAAEEALRNILDKDAGKKAEEAAKRAAEELENSDIEELRKLGEASKAGDEKELQTIAEQLKQKIASSAQNPSDLEQLRKDLEKAAEAAGETPLGQSYKDLADALKKMQDGSADSKDAMDQTDALKEALSKIQKGDTSDYKDLETQKANQDILEQLKRDLADSENPNGTKGRVPSGAQNPSQIPSGSQNPGQIPSGAQNPGQIPSGAQNPRQIPSGSQNPGQNPSSGQNPGQTPGGSQTPGQDPGQTQGQTQGQSGGNGAGRGDGSVGYDTERVYTGEVDVPEGGVDSYIPGAPGEDGNPQKIQIGDKEAQAGTVPYGEVYAEYEQKANEAMEREGIPDTLRDLIEKYFSGLQ